MKRIRDKVALVTGGSSGIGLEITKKLLDEGMQVSICGRDSNKLDKTAKEIEGKKNRIHAMQADVSRKDEVGRWVKAALKEFGRVDVLINNAGVALWSEIENITDDHLNYQFDINLRGPLYCSQAVLPYFRKQGHGYIINISSICGKYGFAGTAAYSISKFGLMALSDSLREEGAGYHIKVTSICPGYVATPLVEDAPIPQDQMIRPTDIAKAVVFLLNLSDYAEVKEMVMTRFGED